METNTMNYLRHSKRVELVRDIKSVYHSEIVDSILDTDVCDDVCELHALDVPINGLRTTEFVFEKTDSVSAVLKYAEKNGKTAVLNFANFTTPGGGFIYGAMAQEEALCVESTLYPVISDNEFIPYYEGNKLDEPALGSLYSNRALYSPDIVFFRNKEEKRCDVITCAAPNAFQYLNAGGSQKANEEALLDRVAFILDIAARKKVKTLILGAFGCGVFGQSPFTLGHIYGKLLLNTYQGVFDRVIFAVIDESTMMNLKNGFNESVNEE